MNYPAPLPAAEQIALCLKAQGGDKAARDRLVLTTMRLVAQRAHFRARINPQSDVEDLTAEGVLGVMHAIGKYDANGGANFATYARNWIDNAIREATVRDAGRTEGLNSASAQVADYNRFAKDVGHDEALRLACELHGTKPETLRARVEAFRRGLARSLDAPLSADGDGATLGEMLPAGGESAEDLADIGEREAIVQGVIQRMRKRLTERERAVFDRRILAHEEDASKLHELGDEFGVSKERIRQIEKALTKTLHLRIRVASRRARLGMAMRPPAIDPAQYMRLRRARHRRNGLCSACIRPVTTGARMCSEHLAKYRTAGEKWRRKQGRGPKRSVTIAHDGQTLSASEWSRRTGLSVSLILYRLRAGWPPERILKTGKGVARLGRCRRGHDLSASPRYASGSCRLCQAESYRARRAVGDGCARQAPTPA